MMSAKLMSICAPSEIMCEKPMPWLLAQSRTVVNRLSDWDKKAVLPGRLAVWARLAFRFREGTMMPMHFGPRMRRAGVCAASSSSSRRRARLFSSRRA